MVRDREAWCAAIHGGHKELDTTGQLNNNNKEQIQITDGRTHSIFWMLDVNP